MWAQPVQILLFASKANQPDALPEIRTVGGILQPPAKHQFEATELFVFQESPFLCSWVGLLGSEPAANPVVYHGEGLRKIDKLISAVRGPRIDQEWTSGTAGVNQR